MADEVAYRNPSLAVDAIALRDGLQGVQVLLITRGFPPWEGRLAFPGGFVEIGEDPETAVLRELSEETGIEGSNPELFAVRGSPNRDPRKHVIGLFYLVDADPDSVPRAGDDAAEAAWIPLSGLTAEELSGDHIRIVEMLRE